MILLVAMMLAILFYWAPDLDSKRFRWIGPGSLFAVMVWIVASAVFGLYVANFGSYSATYGWLGGVIVLLLWLWIADNGPPPRPGAERRPRPGPVRPKRRAASADRPKQTAKPEDIRPPDRYQHSCHPVKYLRADRPDRTRSGATRMGSTLMSYRQ